VCKREGTQRSELLHATTLEVPDLAVAVVPLRRIPSLAGFRPVGEGRTESAGGVVPKGSFPFPSAFEPAYQPIDSLSTNRLGRLVVRPSRHGARQDTRKTARSSESRRLERRNDA
jgi:hypothetical protein